MRIRSTDVICGMPVLELRRLLRCLARRDVFSIERVRRVHSVTRRAAEGVIRDLLAAGYIEPLEDSVGSAPLWQLTPQGGAFTIASAAAPIRRATAHRLVRDLLDRIDAVNADADLLFRVTEAVVFGSYLRDQPTIDDVEVGIRLRSRLPPGRERREREDSRVALARENGRRFRYVEEEFAWPVKEVWLRLKGRSRTLSVYNLDDDEILERDNLETRVIYANGRHA